jgi:protein-disulfide isomerase
LNGKNSKAWWLATIVMMVLVNLLYVHAQSHPAGQATGSNVAGGATGGNSPTRAVPPAPASTLSDAARDKIVKYIRERFGVPDTVKLTLGALHGSAVAPGFNEATVAVDDGKTQRAQVLLISKDSRYLIVVMGTIIELQQNSPEEMARLIQQVFKVPANMKVAVGGFKPSVVPDFEQGTLSIDDGHSPKNNRALLLTRDGKHLIMSEIYPLAVDPREQVLHTVTLRDEATQGPADAPVTIVEYADLECPVCARMNEFLETQVVPRYGNKVRIVFKEYPLPMHDWSMTAAIACQCAYELNPSTFVPLRTAIFRSQQLINITNVRESVLSFGEQAGLDRVKLAGCLDAKSSLPRIQRDMAEAKRIDVNQTPTLYINGRMLIGLPSEDAYFQAIDAALRGK